MEEVSENKPLPENKQTRVGFTEKRIRNGNTAGWGALL